MRAFPIGLGWAIEWASGMLPARQPGPRVGSPPGTTTYGIGGPVNSISLHASGLRATPLEGASFGDREEALPAVGRYVLGNEPPSDGVYRLEADPRRTVQDHPNGVRSKRHTAADHRRRGSEGLAHFALYHRQSPATCILSSRVLAGIRRGRDPGWPADRNEGRESRQEGREEGRGGAGLKGGGQEGRKERGQGAREEGGQPGRKGEGQAADGSGGWG